MADRKSRHTAGAPCFSSTRFIASTRRNRMRSCPTSRRGDIVLIGATTENLRLKSTPRCFPARSTCSAAHRRADRSLPRRALHGRKRDSARCIEISDELLRQDRRLLHRRRARRLQHARNRRWLAAATRRRRAADATITETLIEDAIQKRVLLYDKAGEEHYNLISALHKSVRNSDPAPRSTGWAACSKPAKIPSTSPAALFAWPRGHRHGRPQCSGRDRGGEQRRCTFVGNAGGQLALRLRRRLLSWRSLPSPMRSTRLRRGGAGRPGDRRSRSPCTCAMR